MMYSFDFWGVFFADSMLFIVQLITFGAIFSQVNEINGWSLYQVIVFIGTFSIIDGTCMATYFFGVLTIPRLVRSGDLDLYIVKPVNTLFYVSFYSMTPSSLLVVCSGAFVVVYGLVMGGISVTPVRLLTYIGLLFPMYALMFALMLILRSASFWLVRIDALAELEGQLIEFAYRIPGVVYEGLVKVFLFMVVPYGLIATVPVTALTEGLSPGMWLLTLSITTLFCSLSIFMFYAGLGRYNSASS